VEVEERIWHRAAVSYERVFAGAIGVSHRGKSAPLERVLSDFGIEHSFKQAAGRVKEHYGFEITASAVRESTLKTAARAEAILERKYRESFRILPAKGKATIIAQADGTMICTVAPGKRSGKRPRSWNEMRLVAAQAQGSSQTIYGATFGSVERSAALGHTAPVTLVVGSTPTSTSWPMEPHGLACKPPKSSATTTAFYATSSM